MENLQHIGFNDWFQERVEVDKLAQHDIARGRFRFIKTVI